MRTRIKKNQEFAHPRAYLHIYLRVTRKYFFPFFPFFGKIRCSSWYLVTWTICNKIIRCVPMQCAVKCTSILQKSSSLLTKSAFLILSIYSQKNILPLAISTDKLTLLLMNPKSEQNVCLYTTRHCASLISWSRHQRSLNSFRFVAICIY